MPKNRSDIKCPFCGAEMQIEIWDHSLPYQAHAVCTQCEATGPHVYNAQVGRAEELAIKAMEDYYNKIDADLWRASKGGK